jgi:hypothetical protein
VGKLSGILSVTRAAFPASSSVALKSRSPDRLISTERAVRRLDFMEKALEDSSHVTLSDGPHRVLVEVLLKIILWESESSD